MEPSIKMKYLILFWIIALILFIFYCIFRLRHIKEKYNDMSKLAQSLQSLQNKMLSSSQEPQGIQQQQTLSTQTTIPNAISYINNIQSGANIKDIPGCSKIYDDNLGVAALGYNSCSNAYSDYITKNLDVNKNYGQPNTLAEVCPVTCRTPAYSQCLQSLLQKFTNNANMVGNINNDMSNSINKRIQYRSNALNEIQSGLLVAPHLNKDINDFNNSMVANGTVAKYPSDVFGLVNNYYQKKYQYGSNKVATGIMESFASRPTKSSSKLPVNITDIEKQFFGTYKPINGQFLSFNDLIITLGYNESQNTYGSDYNVINSDTNKNTNTNIILTLSSYNNSLNIIYKVSSIKNYEKSPNAIILNITDENIKDESMSDQENNSQTLQQLINILGIVVPTQLIISYETFTSTENITRSTYKLSNGNLDTIVVLNKI